MFNQEMPTNYVPRNYMVRGVLDPRFGVFYEIVSRGRVYNTFLSYQLAVEECDSLNKQ